MKQRVIIMGAAGRDFHNFNVLFRDDPQYEVVAFTATQIPDIAGADVPAGARGPLYPDGIPIHPEDELERLIREQKADQVVFAYSDVSNQYVMERSALVNAAGADFLLLGTGSTMIQSKRPLISITAVRTGSGKSQTTRRVCQILKKRGRKVAVVRHPMPYGDLVKQACSASRRIADLDRHALHDRGARGVRTPHRRRDVVYAGVDYETILRRPSTKRTSSSGTAATTTSPSSSPTCISSWPIRTAPATSCATIPGEVNLRMADVIVINKVDTADLRGHATPCARTSPR